VTFVQSFGALQTLTETRPPWASPVGISLYGHLTSYAKIYAAQPNVRTCVDFLSRNTAQLGLHIFRRISDTDRERLPDHDLARWLARPNQTTTRYRLIESLVGDLGIYFNAYWLKVPWVTPDGRDAIGLMRLPPAEMTVEGGLLPTQFCWLRNGHRLEFAPDQIVYFNGYNPLDPLTGLSPLETLRRILAEEAAAGEHRESFWRNAGRFEGVIERPLAAPRWTPDQKRSWRDQWQERYAGGAGVGMVSVLEDGMTYKAASFSAKDSEYLSARKLTREECAAAYHIPLPMVGILEHATFSNIKEQHKHLYQDCLGPWLEMIQEAIEAQLLPESTDQRDVYVEFNIADKLKGSFEEQATSLLAMTGRPVMTGNEGRSRINLPRITDDPSMDEVAEQQGGPSAHAPAALAPADDSAAATAAQVALVLNATAQRQRAKLARLPVADRADAFALACNRHDLELATDLRPFLDATEARRVATNANAATLSRLQIEALNDW